MLITNPLNSSELVFPTLECFHIVGFALSIGTIALVEFFAGRRHAPTDPGTARQGDLGLEPWAVWC